MMMSIMQQEFNNYKPHQTGELQKLAKDLWCHCLSESVRNKFLAAYTHLDLAHDINHADTVVYRGLLIAMHLGVATEDVVTRIILAGYAHDAFQMVSRDEHHILAERYCLNELREEYKELSSDDEFWISVGKAVLTHRASCDLEYHDMVGEIIAVADRGCPANITNLMHRSWQYAIHRLRKSPSDAINHAIVHINAKYGRNGYVCNPPLYYSLFEEQLETLWERLDRYVMLRNDAPAIGTTGVMLAFPVGAEDYIDGYGYYIPCKYCEDGWNLLTKDLLVDINTLDIVEGWFETSPSTAINTFSPLFN